MNRKWQISGIISMPSLFVRYHETLCAADYYEKILDEKNQFSFYRFNSVQYEWLDWDFMVDNFEVPIVPQNRVSGRIDEIKFAKFSNYEKRNTLQNLILTEYVELTRLISLMMQNQSFRCTMYNTDIEQLMPPNVSEDISSYVMLEDIIKTIPNIIDKIARIKINIADDLVSLSASSGDYWKSQKQGAIPALRHLIGSVNSETYDWTPYELPEVNLLYPRTINRPEMTNDLRTAIDFVTRFAPNFLEISETDLEIGKPDFYNVIKSRIHEKANEYQDAANKNRYVLISQLFTEYGVTSLTVNNAIDYIYSHMFMFPRSVEEDINEAGNFYLNWENKYKSIPWFYFTKGLTQIYMYQPADDEMSILPEYLGLANILYKSYNYISSIVSSLDMEDPYEECPYNDNIDKDRAIKIENMRKLHAMDSMRLIDNYTGKIKFNLRIMDSNDNSSRLAVTVNNCSEMIKGFGYADDMDNMYYRFRTYTLDDYEQIDGMAAIVCTEYDNDNVYCSDARQDERNYGLTYNYIVDQCNGQIQDLPVGKDIVIEIGVRKSGYEETKWHPIYVIDKKETENFRVGNNEAKYLRPLLDGEIVSMVRRILSYDQKDLNKPQCLPINGLEDECYDRDWVPAIDNEIIDTSGNQYEQSYRHYLETARIAANQARTLRDELISDIITESQEMFVGQHQEDSAIDSYYNNISEICGNNIAVKKDKVKAVVHEDEDLKTLKSRLEELWSIQDEASALEGEQKLGEYGCAGDDESRFGTVQCSVKRNCKIDGSGAASLKEIMPERVGEFMGMSSTGLQIDYPLNNNTPAASLDELFSKNGLKVNMPSPDDDGYYDLVLKEIDRIDGFLFSSKVAISSMINNMKIYQWPALYPWHNYNKEQSIYGAYYEKLNEIDVMRDDISSAVNHYLNGYDRARIALEKIKSTVNVLRYQYDYQQGTAAAQALMQAVNSAFAQNQFEMSIERPWKNCINEVWTRFGYNGKPPQGYGRYDVQKLLLLLNDRFVNGSISIDGAINLQNRYEAFKKSENWFFYDECVRALHETGHHIIVVNPQHPDIICNGFISNFNSSREHLRKWWIEPKDRMSNCIFQTKSEHLGEGWFVSTVYSKWTNIPFDQMGGHPSPYTPSIYETKEPVHSDPNIIIQLQNFRQDEDYAEARPFTSEYNDPTASCSNYQYRGNSASNNKSNISYYINNTEQAVYPLWMLMIQHEMDKCNAYFGCKPTVYSHSKLDYNDPQCDGLFTDSYKDPIAAQQGLSLELDRLLGNLEVASLSQQLDEIKSLMRETTDGFVIGRNELESSVKRMARKIGELGQLEERQIKELDSLANSLALNKAAKYTSLSDWNERYTYRQEEYKKQLNRAKIAAWTARRAIEFRFGIDLSTETTRSLYGDIPSKWADEIYQMGISKCGDSMLETTDTGDSDTESGNVVKQSKVAECLSPEDRIEDYVQKLEDYVSSYGNTPGQNWWFHEDDDIGIVSVRDHIAVTDVSPSAEVQNLLFFTEELDMTELEFNDIYESIVSGFANPGEVLGNGAELPWPSFWQGNADIQSKTSVTDLLGLPPEVRRAHKANDSHVYEDQKEETTAELIKLYSDDTPDLDVELYQTIDLKDVETEAQLSGKEMQFSAYIIKAPEETVCSAGEVYSGAIGRCGLVCDPTDNPCPYAGQDCVYIGDDSIEVSFMCIWCSADRNCLGQDGTVVQMQMEV